MNWTKGFKDFISSERTGGLVLIVCTALSLLLANSGLGPGYRSLFQLQLAGESFEQWINDGLMALFFLLVGLELKQEMYHGKLSHLRQALFPIIGAVGGMIFPGALFLLFNWGTATQAGAGIPMATDIAFALAVLSLSGHKVPASLKVFLTALAVIEDLGAIIMIAVFYTKTILWINLAVSLGVFIVLVIFNKLKVKTLPLYLSGGIVMWYFMLHSGVHATVTGVLLAFTIPLGKEGGASPSSALQHFLHQPVAFVILPLFALANTAIVLSGNPGEVITANYSLGILTGLIAGKPLGIVLFTFMAVSLGLCRLPEGLNWKAVFGIGLLGGIGFTMSIFITLLAFSNETIINNSKLVILSASLISGSLGFFALKTY